MSGKDFDDYELGGEGFLPFKMQDNGEVSYMSAGIKTAAPAKFAFATAVPAPYEIDDLVGSDTAVPRDFVATGNQSARMDVLPANFDPHQMWNFTNDQ